jgi:Ca2+-binding RTX toxin-like protein
VASFVAAVGTAQAVHLEPDTQRHTTLEQILVGGAPYATLSVAQVNEDFVLRDGATEPNSGAPVAQPGREGRRQSLAYVSQMTDFQLADEESPARVEFLDQGPSSAWRPAEAFHPFAIDASVRQLNSFAAASPVPQANGTGNAMDFALITGDQADNNQRNETVWVRELLEGGRTLNFNSGLTDPAAYSPQNLPSPTCQLFVAQEGGTAQAAQEGATYTGVQDYDDYPAAPNNYFYDPDEPAGNWAADGWPEYDGLMDRAQTLSITPEGLAVPFYITNGNHDVLVQGNEDANQAFEDIATGCTKVLGTTATPPAGGPDPDPNTLFLPSGPPMLIPPDPQRQFVSKPQIKEVYGAAIEGDDDHGFAYVDPAEAQASNGSASYYAWNPPETPGFRFISIDTNSEGGQTAEGVAPGSSNGNIDDPQFKWLERELKAAQEAGQLIVIFGHHPVRSMNTLIVDEQAAPCTTDDAHGHDVNPGCDLDPRISSPVHLGQGTSPGETFVSLISRYQNVIAYVPGHTHENKVTGFRRSNGSVWWELNTSAVADNPQQSRLIDVMNNNDGTISIFSAVVDHASPATAPAPGPASGFDNPQLASIGRTFAFNDPQIGSPNGEGEPIDQNVELLVDHPLPQPGENCGGDQATIVGTPGDDVIEGTDGRDVILALGGDDLVKGNDGKDKICGSGGKDKLKGGRKADTLKGQGANDKLNGARGRDKLEGDDDNDKLKGGRGKDRLEGGPGRDRLRGGKGRDSLDGGDGEDRCKGGGSKDRAKRC